MECLLCDYLQTLFYMQVAGTSGGWILNVFRAQIAFKSIYFVCCSSSYGNTGDINDSNFYVGSILEFVYDYMANVLELKIVWLYD